MTPMSEREWEIRVKYLERELQELKWSYLDAMAEAALSSGRYAHTQCYDIANKMLEARKCIQPSKT